MDSATAIERAEAARRQMTVFGSLNVQTFIVHAIKAPMIFAFKHSRILKLIDKVLPEPTVENTWHPNTHRLLAIREDFFRHCNLTPERIHLLRVVSKFVIIIHDYDTPYRAMINWCVQELFKSGWEPGAPVSSKLWRI